MLLTVAGPNVKRFIERSVEHMSAHVYNEKDEVLQKKKKQRQTFAPTSTIAKDKK